MRVRHCSGERLQRAIGVDPHHRWQKLLEEIMELLKAGPSDTTLRADSYEPLQIH